MVVNVISFSFNKYCEDAIRIFALINLFSSENGNENVGDLLQQSLSKQITFKTILCINVHSC